MCIRDRFVSPAARDTRRLSPGFSAVIKKLWNTYCRIKAGMERNRMLPYATQFSRSSPVAPSASEMGRIKIKPRCV